jgi:predicted permease
VTSVAVDLKQNGYDEQRGRVFYRKLLDAARGDALTEAATLAAFDPVAFLETPAQPVAIEGYEPRRGEDLAFLFNVIAPEYFRTLKIAVLAGRAFEDRDDGTAPAVAIVNQTFAERFWGGTPHAIGQRVRLNEGAWRTVVGVAADVKYVRIDESPRPYLYVPLWQNYRSAMSLYMRGRPPDDVLVETARAHVTALDGDLPILTASTLSHHLTGALMLFDLTAIVLFVFGAVGMLLAALGTYGLVAYTVKQSTREIGIRLALGATGPSVVRAFLGRGVRLGAIGSAVGVAVALAVSRLLEGVLYGVSATDATAFGRALVIVMSGVIAAAIVPAWRASRTNALTALRQQ